MIDSVMLITSCPECETTFRISVGILEKAGGQVRCGRCARVFDANDALREIDEAEVAAPEDESVAVEASADETTGQPDEATIEAAAEEIDAEQDDEVAAAADEESAEEIAVAADADPAEEIAVAAEQDREAERADKAEPAEAAVEPDWLAPVAAEAPIRSRWWSAGAALLSLTLIGQLVHQFRDRLVTWPAVGPVVERVYSGMGAEIIGRVNLDQYNLLDLTALAEPAGEEQGWLVIETRVQNRGPKVQPYPHIFVRLLDRWEDTVAGRYFGPDEYTVTTISDYSRMNVGTTVDAQFIIMDPGPSATGFELELCTRIARGYMCESDASFQ
jgi:predicted Zn finger-like uncharacterized protein